MTISVGDKLPEGKVVHIESDKPNSLNMHLFSMNKVIALFSVPGAFTPTCNKKHLPGFISQEVALKKNGVDVICCLSVNDIHVMNAWSQSSGACDKIKMLADGNCSYTTQLGMELDLSVAGMGMRGRRFSMLIDNGVVKILNVEEPREFKVSSAEILLEQIS
ncbi:MAG: peroxiredoxin [Rhodospirillaceae bacterium]|nr:peroxiredoxin [Rhodospirillaceae bacterium]|tara:strand:+ start:1271 stop:1756 length:486 start_codon:yes stop_codon:yes gene_type:complete